MPDYDFLTPVEAAKYLRVCKATVYKLIKAGKLPAVRAGKQLRIARSSIDKIYGGNHSKKAGTGSGVGRKDM